MSVKFNVHHAGELIKRSYNLRKRRGKKLDNIKTPLDINGVQAYLLDDGTLVIPGSNQASDYTDFNLKTSGRKGIKGRYYHKGFLTHAQTIITKFRSQKPKLIIGHSLGGASAQIVGLHFRVPTIAFASPKVLMGTKKIAGESYIANFQREDDPVCRFPYSTTKYRHVGNVYWIKPKLIDFGLNHKVENYMKLIKDNRRNKTVPRRWPS